MLSILIPHLAHTLFSFLLLLTSQAMLVAQGERYTRQISNMFEVSAKLVVHSLKYLTNIFVIRYHIAPQDSKYVRR